MANIFTSSIGKKLIMSITGAFLILFLTFHMIMNGALVFSDDAYNAIVNFLGANWYALVGTVILAAGVVFDGENMGNAYAVAITIALQNIPEGMVVVTPLLMIGVGYLRVTLVGLAVALMEIAGVLSGYFLGDISAAFLPAMTAIAGGAMLYVISDEMIPETHSHGFEKQATYALVAGVMCMLYIQMFV